MLDDKVREACHRIEDLYHETDGKCYVSFSGGKDSTVILGLIKLCSELYTLPSDGIKAVFSNTGIELDVTLKFVEWCQKEWYRNIEIIHPIKPFSQVLSEYGKPMKSKMKSHVLHQWKCGSHTEALFKQMINDPNGGNFSRTRIADKDMHFLHPDFPITASEYCCDWMKKKPFMKYEQETGMKGCITGIRTSEGGVRSMQTQKRVVHGGKLCTATRNGVIYKYPIIDWTDQDIEEFIEKYNIPLSDAYTKYHMSRTGCMACPYSQNLQNDLKYLYEHEQNKYKASMFFLKDVYIAQNVELPFDEEYEKERIQTWNEKYIPMRAEMLKEYRPNSRLLKKAGKYDINDEMQKL